MAEDVQFSPSRAATVGSVVALRLLDLTALGVGGRALSGRPCPVGCLQEGIANWDAHWYSGIAAFGYSYIPGTDSNVAFFPAFPLLMRWTAPLTGGNYLWSGLAVSLAVSFVAVLLAGRLMSFDYGATVGRRMVILLSASPVAFFFALPYADGLLLLFCVLSLFAARRRLWLWAAIFAAAAGTVRITGALLLIPLIWELCEQHGWRLRELLSARGAARLATLAIAPVGIGAYMLWLGAKFSEPFAFVKAQLDGWPHRTTWALRPVWDTVVELARPWRHLGGLRPDLYWAYALDITVLIVATVLFVMAIRRKMPVVYLLWWGLALIFPIMSGTTNSLARYSLIAFPMYGAAAVLFRKRGAFQAVAAACVLAQMALAYAHGAGRWVG